jgi:hypothetical protein
MKVKELMRLLEKENPESEVILQKDSEGNGYSPLYAVDGDAVYVPASTYSGDVFSLEWSADEACMPEPAWEAMKQQPRCVVLAPTN